MTSASAIADRRTRVPAEVHASRRSLLDFVEASGLRSLVVGVSKDPNAKVTMLLFSPCDGRLVFAVKVPTTDAAARAVEVERRVLVELGERGRWPAPASIPRVVDVLEFEGRPAAVMTAVPGVPMSTSYFGWRHTASSARVAADFEAVATWLADFQRPVAREPAPMDMGGGVAARLRRRFAEDEGLSADLDRLAKIHRRLSRNVVPRTPVHGDLWFGNMLLAGGRVSGVVDWEAGATCGEPARDLVRFALAYALYLDRRTRAGRRVAGHPGLRAGSWGAGVEYAIEGAGWFPDLFRRFLGDGLERLGASAASWRDAALAGIAEVAARTDDPAFAHAHLKLFRRLWSSTPDSKGVQ